MKNKTTTLKKQIKELEKIHLKINELEAKRANIKLSVLESMTELKLSRAKTSLHTISLKESTTSMLTNWKLSFQNLAEKMKISASEQKDFLEQTEKVSPATIQIRKTEKKEDKNTLSTE